MEDSMCKLVLYGSEEMMLSKFYDEPVLWILDESQIKLPHVRFVGGTPSEWCIFLKDLPMEELQRITDTSGYSIFETDILPMME